MFPLQAVLFPGGRLPLRIFEQRYMDMAKRCLKDGSPFGVCAIREGTEVGAPATPYDVGTLARIGEWDMPQLGVLQIVALAGERFRIVERRIERNGLQVAGVTMLAPEADAPVADSASACVRLLERVIEQQPEIVAAPHRLDSASWVGARLAELLPLPLAERQALLELDDPVERLGRLNAKIRASRAGA
ncbi:MAG TPA: LON peptidase substrate-binding domain-containing protein [Planctomycetota bacterium]|nr:LON peptidase substrate-binding domain-containing protein [Planctomycetota bacterium]